MDPVVRLTVSKVDLEGSSRHSAPLLDLEDTAAAVVETARAWAQVRGYDSLAPTIERVFGGDPPKSGFAVLINKPHSLLVMATWPWYPSRPSTWDR